MIYHILFPTTNTLTVITNEDITATYGMFGV